MPPEPNIVTVALVLAGIVMATIAGGLIGRRVRTWQEHRVARKALSKVGARGATAATVASATTVSATVAPAPPIAIPVGTGV
ncbi:MAG TPA: hypothetical protein VGM28_10435, partial [Candidatus Limnocylindrales bacterium]